MTKFAQRFKELREDRKLSQNQLSNKTGITVMSISRWESGRNVPSIESLIALANFFGVTIDFLVGRTDY